MVLTTRLFLAPRLVTWSVLLDSEKDLRPTTVGVATVLTLTEQRRLEGTSDIRDFRADLTPSSPRRRQVFRPASGRPALAVHRTGRKRSRSHAVPVSANEIPQAGSACLMTLGWELRGISCVLWLSHSAKPQRQISQ